MESKIKRFHQLNENLNKKYQYIISFESDEVDEEEFIEEICDLAGNVPY